LNGDTTFAQFSAALDAPASESTQRPWHYLYFVAISQWSKFDNDDGQLEGHDGPAVLDRIELDRH
jgi:hypothetical protein